MIRRKHAFPHDPIPHCQLPSAPVADHALQPTVFPYFLIFLFSEKDGEVHHFDLCEECYDEVTGEFRVAVEVEEEIEML